MREVTNPLEQRSLSDFHYASHHALPLGYPVPAFLPVPFAALRGVVLRKSGAAVLLVVLLSCAYRLGGSGVATADDCHCPVLWTIVNRSGREKQKNFTDAGFRRGLPLLAA